MYQCHIGKHGTVRVYKPEYVFFYKYLFTSENPEKIRHKSTSRQTFERHIEFRRLQVRMCRNVAKKGVIDLIW